VTELAVTGVGVVSPLGIGRSAFVEAIRAGSRATFGEVRPETLDTAEYPLARIAEVLGFDAKKYLGDKGLRSLDRLTTLLIVAARLALHDSRLKKDGAWAAGSPDRVGIVVSNAYGSLEAITELDRVATLEDARYINPSRFPLTVSNTAAGYASIWEELRAVNVSVSDGNCGGLDAVECARVLLAQSRADALIVGGVEAMSEALALAFHRLGALTAGARLGEGSALVAVETLPGYGTAFLPPEREASLVHATPDAVERAIVDALADAALDARDIDVVISGVCGLQPFDQAELVAIERTLGEDTCVVAPKLALGETLGAGGAMGMLVAIALMSPGKDAPTGDLAVRGVLRAPPRKALVTSLGYYGNASALVMSAPSR
jgi:3-oxoacyl-[acyl-carrier-protein] synthase II